VPPEKIKIILWVCLIFVLVLVSFYPCLKNNFTNWDDNLYVTENTAIRSLGLANLQKISTAYFITHFQPLTILSYALEYHFFGQDAFFYHLTNLFLHLLNSLLVFWLLYFVSGSLPAAAIAAIFFGIHPLQVESVAWVSQRKTVLYVFFYLGALVSYLYYLRRNLQIKYYFFCLSLFICALLSKSVAFTLPLVLWLLDYIYARNLSRRLFTEKVPFLILSLLIGIVALRGGYLATFFDPGISYNLLTRLTGACSDIIFYLYKLCWPVKLSAIYPYLEIKDNPLYLICPAGVAVLFTALAFLALRSRKIIFGGVFFLLTIFPAVRFMPLEEVLVADHYVYLGSLGIFYLFAQGIIWLFKKQPKHQVLVKGLIILLVAALAIICVLVTRQRCGIWKDSLSLWNDVLGKYPASATAYNNRGEFFLGEKNFERAIADFKEAIKIRGRFPDNPAGKYYYLNLGNALRANGDLAKAQAVFEELISQAEVYFRQPGSAAAAGDKNQVLASHRRHIESGAYFNLGNIKDALGEKNEAQALYLRAIELSSRQPYAHECLGDLYFAQGKIESARSEFLRAIEIDPHYLPAYIKLAKIYRDLGQNEELGNLYKKAITRKLLFFEAYYYLGNLYADAQMERKANFLYRQAVKINPDSKEACLGLGNTYLAIRRNRQAIFWLSRALALDPALAVAHNNLALAYYYAGQYALAVKHYDQAVKLGYQPSPKLTQLLKLSKK
jgi:tetratricopeptide (TPR) repeat protein